MTNDKTGHPKKQCILREKRPGALLKLRFESFLLDLSDSFPKIHKLSFYFFVILHQRMKGATH